MRRCDLKGALGDAMHAVLCAAGYNIRWLLRWIALFWLSILAATMAHFDITQPRLVDIRR